MWKHLKEFRGERKGRLDMVLIWGVRCGRVMMTLSEMNSCGKPLNWNWPGSLG